MISGIIGAKSKTRNARFDWLSLPFEVVNTSLLYESNQIIQFYRTDLIGEGNSIEITLWYQGGISKKTAGYWNWAGKSAT